MKIQQSKKKIYNLIIWFKQIFIRCFSFCRTWIRSKLPKLKNRFGQFKNWFIVQFNQVFTPKRKEKIVLFAKSLGTKLYQLAIWIWDKIIRFYAFLKMLKEVIPPKVKAYLFQFAEWGKDKLDGIINTEERERLNILISDPDTKEGKQFETVLLWLIVISILVVMLESISSFHKAHWWLFFILEWIFTIIFTIEYILRLYASRNPIKYATSFFGIVDLLATIPSYLGIFFLGAQNLLVIRALRLIRVVRIFKIGHFVSEGTIIVSALKASRTKIYVFTSFILLMALIIGSLLYIVEGSQNPKINNIPQGVYWAIVTLTTVGYGDVTPVTPLGQLMASIVMIMGYGVIAVPTGIVTAEISGRVMNLKEVIFKICPTCEQPEHHTHAVFCHKCGGELGR